MRWSRWDRCLACSVLHLLTVKREGLKDEGGDESRKLGRTLLVVKARWVIYEVLWSSKQYYVHELNDERILQRRRDCLHQIGRRDSPIYRHASG